MNFKLMTCYRQQKNPKVNVASKKSVKKKSSGTKKRKKSSNHRHRVKNSYVASNLFSKNFYPANYFFQDEPKNQLFDTRVGVNNQSGLQITKNTPHLAQSRRTFPSSRTLSQQYLWKVGSNRSNLLITLSDLTLSFDNLLTTWVQRKIFNRKIFKRC